MKTSLPESEGGAPREEHGLGFGLGLLEEAEEGVVLHADLPEDLAAVPAGHEELQRVLVRTLRAAVDQKSFLKTDGDIGRRRQFKRSSRLDPASA